MALDLHTFVNIYISNYNHQQTYKFTTLLFKILLGQEKYVFIIVRKINEFSNFSTNIISVHLLETKETDYINKVANLNISAVTSLAKNQNNVWVKSS